MEKAGDKLDHNIKTRNILPDFAVPAKVSKATTGGTPDNNIATCNVLSDSIIPAKV